MQKFKNFIFIHWSPRKIRADQTWIEATLRAASKPSAVDEARDTRENLELAKRSEEAPMPTTVSAFKVQEKSDSLLGMGRWWVSQGEALCPVSVK